nr:MAG TPA: hypothetical protein [Caudoviricetes sp.]
MFFLSFGALSSHWTADKDSKNFLSAMITLHLFHPVFPAPLGKQPMLSLVRRFGIQCRGHQVRKWILCPQNLESKHRLSYQIPCISQFPGEIRAVIVPRIGMLIAVINKAACEGLHNVCQLAGTSAQGLNGFELICQHPLRNVGRVVETRLFFFITNHSLHRLCKLALRVTDGVYHVSNRVSNLRIIASVSDHVRIVCGFCSGVDGLSLEALGIVSALFVVGIDMKMRHALHRSSSILWGRAWWRCTFLCVALISRSLVRPSAQRHSPTPIRITLSAI